MSFLERAHLAATRLGPRFGTFCLCGGTIFGLLFARFYFGWSYKQSKLNRQCSYAEELFQQQLQKEQGISEAHRT